MQNICTTVKLHTERVAAVSNFIHSEPYVAMNWKYNIKFPTLIKFTCFYVLNFADEVLSVRHLEIQKIIT